MASRFRWTLTNTPVIGAPTSEVLTKDPIGWEDMTIKLARHKVYNGVFTEFTLSLKWHCNGGGKEFIDNIYQTYDINGNITCLIEIDCDSSGTYIELYTGKINLASYSTDGEYTTCNIERSDLFTKLIAREEINVDLETTSSIGAQTITAPTPKTLPMHSQKIFLQSAMDGDVPFDKDNAHPAVSNSVVFRGLISHALTTQNSEADRFFGWTDYDDMASNGPGISDSLMPEIFEAIDGNVEYPATYTCRGQFAGTFTDTVVGTPTRTNTLHTLTLRWGPTLATSSAVTLYSSFGYTTSANPFTEAFDTGVINESITLNFGDKVWLAWIESETITTGPYLDKLDYNWQYDTAEFSIEIDSSTSATACKAMMIHEAFNQVCDAIADSDFKFYSEFYGRTDSEKIVYPEDGCGSKIAITNGLNIREFDNKSIFCNLRDLFNSANALHNIGLTIEEVDPLYAGVFEAIRVEPIAFFFDTTTQILNLTRPVKVNTTNDNTRYYNRIIMGYEKWEAEFKGGLDDPNTKHEYSTKVNAVNSQYQRLCKYIGSGYALEFTRRKNSDIEKTEDWRYDNDNFVIATKNVFIGTVSFLDGLGVIGGMVVSGLSANNVQPGDILEISGSALNDGTYTVTVVSEIYSGGITVTMVEPTVAEVVADVTIDNTTEAIYSPEVYSDFLDLVLPTGMIQAFTAYNLRLTPARMLQPHVKSISAGLSVIAGQIKFINGEGNTELLTQISGSPCPESFSGNPLQENDSFPWNDSAIVDSTPLWVPEIYEFEYPLSASDLAAIRANPHGYISVLDDHGNTKSGFILDVEYRLKTGRTKFQLLRRYE